MKKLALITAFFLIALSVKADITAWTELTADGGFTKRNISATCFFDGRWWITCGDGAGADAYKDIWYSYNGIAWYEATNDAACGRRFSHTAIAFNNQMLVISGSNNNDFTGTTARKDVWATSNGVDWYALTENAEFGCRYSHLNVVYDNKIWLIGGFKNGSPAKDVWNSLDGVVWEQVIGAANFNAMIVDTASSVCVFDNKMWVLENGSAVWYSTTGDVWTKTADLSLGGEETKLVALSDRMYLIGGSGTVNSSSDGITWTPELTGTYDARTRFNVIGIDDPDAILVLNGTASGPVYFSDCWSGDIEELTKTITPTFTASPTSTVTPTKTATRTRTPTRTRTQTRTITATNTPKETKTFTATVSPTFTATSTLTATETITETWTITETETATFTITPTYTPTTVPTMDIYYAWTDTDWGKSDCLICGRQYPGDEEVRMYYTAINRVGSFENEILFNNTDDMNPALNVWCFLIQGIPFEDCVSMTVNVKGGDLAVDFWSEGMIICPKVSPTPEPTPG